MLGRSAATSLRPVTPTFTVAPSSTVWLASAAVGATLETKTVGVYTWMPLSLSIAAMRTVNDATPSVVMPAGMGALSEGVAVAEVGPPISYVPSLLMSYANRMPAAVSAAD